MQFLFINKNTIFLIPNVILILLYYIPENISVFVHLSFLLYFITGYYTKPVKKYLSLIFIKKFFIAFFPGALTLLITETCLQNFFLKDSGFLVLLLIVLVISLLGYFIGRLLIYVLPKSNYNSFLFWGVVLVISTSMFGFYSRVIQFIITGIAYLLVSFFLFKKSRQKVFLKGLLLYAPFFLLFTLAGLFISNLSVLPIHFIVAVNIILGWLLVKLYKLTRITAYITIGILLLLISFGGYFGMHNWLAYIRIDRQIKFESREIYNTLNKGGIINKEGIGFDSPSSDERKLQMFFFPRWCGICFEKLPELEELHRDYQSNPAVEIIAVNIQYFEADTIFNFEKYHSNKGYTFPIKTVDYLYGPEMKEKLEIRSIPHVMIVNEHFDVIYVGGFNIKKLHLVGNIRTIIEKNL